MTITTIRAYTNDNFTCNVAINNETRDVYLTMIQHRGTFVIKLHADQWIEAFDTISTQFNNTSVFGSFVVDNEHNMRIEISLTRFANQYQMSFATQVASFIVTGWNEREQLDEFINKIRAVITAPLS